MTDQSYGNKPLFVDLNAGEDQESSKIESMCINCEENGITQILLTKIPHYKEVVLMSFECEHCGYKNNEIQPGARIQDKGCTLKLTVQNEKDLNRQVVKSDAAMVLIPALQFEIPSNTQKGVLTTIEGLISRAVEGLEQDQPLRKALDPETATKIQDFIDKMKNLKPPFELTLDDPTGNSYIENPDAPAKDKYLTTINYTRTKEQDIKLGLVAVEAEGIAEDDDEGDVADLNKEVLSFQSNCSKCNSPLETHMKLVNIPHFKEVVIMASHCDACGDRSNEVKAGGGIEPEGSEIILNITDPIDLNRDILKSETCTVKIPALDFELCSGTLGGKFTTLEGLLTDIKGQLSMLNTFQLGDSSRMSDNTKMTKFLSQLDKVITGELKVNIILNDPAGNSYIQNLYAPETDPELTVRKYTRTAEQIEELGLDQLNTDNYSMTSNT
ncbi:zinc finger protein ZPR1-like [Anneissia japonica]|uniref:zinc finger protein ZPR1-like n=1 Tax=Anneissia japonica TaxID=1529436 RepID=UPI001425AC91|nr:zinc finger protein ZPR1-like [Anneissia japonica]